MPQEGLLNNISGERVLVTGGYGAIGAMVVRRLLELGALPVVMDVLEENPYLSDVEADFVSVNQSIVDLAGVVDAMKREGVTQVIHLAKALGPKTEDDPTITLNVNVLGTGHILEACRRLGIRRVVFSSSKSVYGPMSGSHAYPTLEPITEDYPKFERGDDRRVLFYSTTNKMVEYYGIRFARRFDMEFVVTRFASTYGPGKSRRRVPVEGGGFVTAQDRTAAKRKSPYKTFGNLASFVVEAAFERQSLHLSEGADERADLVYNADLANGLIAAVCSDDIRFQGNWREFHLGLGRAVSVRDVVEAVKGHFPGADLDIGPGTISGYDHSETLTVFDLTRAREELGYVPMYPPEAAVEHYETMLQIDRRNSGAV